MNNDPLVSIVIPCYKGEAFLAEALDSCIAQTYRNIEIIVVDDASPDRCAEIAEEYALRDERIRIIRLQKNGGVAHAFNSGFRIANGDLFSRLAQDDLFEPQAISVLVNELIQHPELSLVYSDTVYENIMDGLSKTNTAPQPEDVRIKGAFIGLCVMWRKSIRDELGEFDSSFDSAEDYEYWLRVAKQANIARIDCTPLLKVRIHDEMGSKVYSMEQKIATAKALCRHVLPASEHKSTMSTAYMESAWIARNRGLMSKSLSLYLKAAINRPHDPMVLKALIGAIIRYPFSVYHIVQRNPKDA